MKSFSTHALGLTFGVSLVLAGGMTGIAHATDIGFDPSHLRLVYKVDGGPVPGEPVYKVIDTTSPGGGRFTYHSYSLEYRGLSFVVQAARRELRDGHRHQVRGRRAVRGMSGRHDVRRRRRPQPVRLGQQPRRLRPADLRDAERLSRALVRALTV